MSTLSDLLDQLQAVQEVDEALRRAHQKADASGRKHYRPKPDEGTPPARYDFNSWVQAVISAKIVEEVPRALTAAVKADNLGGAEAALMVLRLVGSSADPLEGCMSLLASAILHRCSLPMIELVVANAHTHLSGISSDAWPALQACQRDAWREAVEGMLRKASEHGEHAYWPWSAPRGGPGFLPPPQSPIRRTT